MTALRWRRRLRRSAGLFAATAAVAALVWFGFERLAAGAVNGQRQRHLSGSFQSPKPTVRPGDAVAVIQIPSLDVNAVVVEGATVDHLRGGPVRLTDGAMPGEAGVMVILGHRAGYGAEFEKLTELLPGNDVVIQARNGPIIGYKVTELRSNVSLTDVDVSADGVARLLLVTGAGERLSGALDVVIAEALPVNGTVTRIPDLESAAFERQPLGIDAVLFDISAIGAAFCWVFLRRRTSPAMAVCITLPVAATSALFFMFMLDSVRPLVR
jgi:LPXTG-site transpeptidase (sortase) family protein